MPLHGEQVLETADGVYETVATQRGTVDEVTSAELTVTSEDGYSRTYTLTAESLVDEWSGDAVDLALGDNVMVVATVDGSVATAARAIDLDALPSMPDRSSFGGHGHGGPGWDRDSLDDATPAPTATIEGSSV